MKTLELNNLPVLTWNHLKVNHTAVDDAGDLFGPDPALGQEPLLPGRRLSREEEEELVSSAPRIPAESAQAGKVPEYGASGGPFFPAGLGADYGRLLKEKGVMPVLAEIPAVRSDTRVVRRKALGEGEFFLDDGILVVGEGAKAEVITVLAGKTPSMPCGRRDPADGDRPDERNGRGAALNAGTAALRTRIILRKGASLTFVRAQLLDAEYTCFDDIGAVLEEGAELKLIQTHLGAGRLYTGMQAYLAGRRSRLEADMCYRAAGIADANYTAVFGGRQTEARMSFDGVLEEGAVKTFRDTLDFRAGASGARGREEENVLLLSDSVVNRSVPLILCGEEDVDGRHAATLGRLPEDMLFYFASRGIDRESAVRMMAGARLSKAALRIPEEKTAAEVLSFIRQVNRGGK